MSPAHLISIALALLLLLLLQTARYLLKALAAGQSGKPVGGSAAYLGQLQQELRSSCSARGADCWGNPGEAAARVVARSVARFQGSLIDLAR